ncbi:MAG: UDP-4-amino-4,6-dideoxy-N-acetyl-beta-L-altrosamine transaminase [Planctomycetaceae bacterium]|jgi:UDP-4-amino-4,6-dideoxy-N-acetyl-beta-L-altrosamine transaminase|nr:UDP-4-amino-4,6-dideoxy-N-acetyl-beta-L-altrosamine transaminase [Planctomycetaceae bacterium]
MPPNMKRYGYGHQSISEADINIVVKAMRSEFLTQGPLVAKFEEALCQYTGAKYAVVVANGTVALHLAMLVLEIEPNDEVITSPNTFLASANCVVYANGKPKFADIDSATANIDPKNIEKQITQKTKAIIPVHFAGQSCDMQAIQNIAKKYNLKIIEDAAHAIGSNYKNTKVGSCKYSDLTTFSFHPVKTITTGEGGAIMTNDKNLYEKLLMLRSHGMTKNPKRLHKNDGQWYYEMQLLGYNGRLTDIQSALGISQLKRIDQFKSKRRKIVETYKTLLGNDERFSFLKEKLYSDACFHLCPLLVNFGVVKKTKREIFVELSSHGINLQVHYIPVHTQPFYKNYGYKLGDFPLSEEYYKKTMSLPLYTDLTQCDIKYITKIIQNIVK